MTFRVTPSSPSGEQAARVWHTTEDRTDHGRAIAGSDFLARSGWLTIDTGETSLDIAVQVYGDETREPDELLAVKLGDPQNAKFPDDLVGAMRAQCYVRNDDFVEGSQR